MKKFLLALPTVLFPYIPLILIVSGVWLPVAIAIAAVMFFVTLIFTVLYYVFAFKHKWETKTLALFSMLVKLLHIPAYIMLFVVGLGGMLMVKLIAVTLFVVIFDWLLMFLSGVLTLPTYIKALKGHIITGFEAIILSVFSFIFCIDILFAVVAYILISKRNGAKQIPIAVPDVNL